MRALTALKNNGYFAIKLAIIQDLDTKNTSRLTYSLLL